ncbi:MAG: hypothetical protein WC722_12555 [Rhodospirillales bacterium]|jgi:hypothetical protein
MVSFFRISPRLFATLSLVLVALMVARPHLIALLITGFADVRDALRAEAPADVSPSSQARLVS